MTMLSTWEKARKIGRDESKLEGKIEGKIEGEALASARAVLTGLRARGITVSQADRDRVLGDTDTKLLDLWIEGAATLSGVAEVFAQQGRT